jgi:hypothetical protein
MKNIFKIVKVFFGEKNTGSVIIEGVEKVAAYKLDKTKLKVAIIIILTIALISGAISEETYIKLFFETY